MKGKKKKKKTILHGKGGMRLGYQEESLGSGTLPQSKEKPNNWKKVWGVEGINCWGGKDYRGNAMGCGVRTMAGPLRWESQGESDKETTRRSWLTFQLRVRQRLMKARCSFTKAK